MEIRPRTGPVRGFNAATLSQKAGAVAIGKRRPIATDPKASRHYLPYSTARVPVNYVIKFSDASGVHQRIIICPSTPSRTSD